MPYFIYRIAPDKQLECLEQHPKYRPAREQARQMRAEQASNDPDTIKMIFAENRIEAERLLLTPREVPVEGDD